MPVIVVATIRPLPQYRDEVTTAMLAAVEQVHGEDGCELYALHRDDDRLVMIERWAGPAALQAHSTASAALQRLSADLDGKLEAPLDVVVLEPVPGGDPAKGQL
jgi:quinol monooxygenase YgiN